MHADIRAILVCKDFGDILTLTLPHNRHHFSEVMIVTSEDDTETIDVAKQCNAKLFLTNSFYANGASFNKWLALEEGLTEYGRHGLLTLMDADILWPQSIDLHVPENCLVSPTRRLCIDLKNIPEQKQWKYCPFIVDYEWAGYTQLFWADDKHLPQGYWHQTNWRHAGGADSYFQRLWPRENKLRPTWEVLHLGPINRNWCGRVTTRTDGTQPLEADSRRAQLQEFMAQRRFAPADDPYRAELLSDGP